jgi:hypothetical protein
MMRRPSHAPPPSDRDSAAQHRPTPASPPNRAVIDGDPALAAALQRCADGDPAGLAELRAWRGERLRATLLRVLGDPSLADRALEAALVDLWQNAAVVAAIGHGPAEDRVFACLRRHARAVAQGDAAPIVGISPTPAKELDEPPAEAPAPAPERVLRPLPSEPRAQPDPAPTPPVSPAAADPLPEWRRAPRPSAAMAVRARIVEEAPYARHQGRSRVGRWALLLLVWLLAAGAGFALALFTLGVSDPGLWPVAERAPDTAPAPEPPPLALGPATPPQNRPPSVAEAPSIASRPPVEELIGPPIEAREPPPAPLPPDPDLAIGPASPPPLPQARPAAEAALPGPTRIFIHYPAGAADAAARAQALAQLLRQRGAGVVEIRPVPFAIASGGVRYFHAADRAAAVRLLGLTRSALAGSEGNRMPPTPGDFSYFRPSPSPGTLEVWLPGAQF